MKPVTIEVMPADASKSGRNAFYHSCPLLNRRASYAVCLHTIEAQQEGRLPDSCECGPHIGRRLCAALEMRELELAAGRAMFFQERVFPSVVEERAIKKLNPDAKDEILGPSRPDDRSYMRGWNMAGGAKPAAPAKKSVVKELNKPASDRLFGTKSVTLADTVNAMAKEELADKVVGSAAPAASASTSPKKDEPRPLMQYVAKLIRKGDKELWRREMSAIIRKFKFDQETQKRLVAAATTLAKSSHPLNNAFVPESR